MNEWSETSSGLVRASESDRGLEGMVLSGAYRISKRLGSGGMGQVYEAEHVRLGNRVAVKFPQADVLSDSRAVERFRREAQRASRVRSENIVKVFDYGELPDGTPYFVMERLFGVDLRTLLSREGPLPIRRAVKLIIDACRGLSVVHAAGLVHRDLKPANLFVEQFDDGSESCKVLDFGVVKALATDTTRQGAVIGTVRYMAPEQLESSGSTTASADVYALGAILYECLTGVVAHDAETLQQMMYAILHHDPRSPSELRPMPRALEAIVLRALSRDVAIRFSNAGDFARSLEPFGAVAPEPRLLEAVDENTLSDHEPAPHAAGRSRPRRPAALVRGAVVLGALFGGAIAGFHLRGDTAPAQAAVQSRPLLASGPTMPPSAPCPVPDTKAPAPEPLPELGVRHAASAPAPKVRKTVRATPPSNERAPSLADRLDPSDPYR